MTDSSGTHASVPVTPGMCGVEGCGHTGVRRQMVGHSTVMVCDGHYAPQWRYPGGSQSDFHIEKGDVWR